MERKRTNAIFLTFLFSYTIILSLPLAIGGIGYYRASRILSQVVSKSQLALLDEIRQILDNEMSNIQSMSWQIAQNSQVQSYLKVGAKLTPADRLESSYVVRALRPYATGHSYLWNLFVYFERSDSIITPSARYDPQLFFRHIAIFGTRDPMWLFDYVRHFHGFFACLPAIRVAGNDAPRKVIPVVQAIRSAYYSNPPGVVVSFIDEQKLTKLIESVYPGSFVEIVDRDGKTILESGTKPVDLPKPEATWFGSSRGRVLFAHNYAVSLTETKDGYFKLYSYVPERIYLRRLRNFTDLVIVILCIAALLGSAAAVAFARRNSRPLRQLLDSIGGTEAPREGRRRNELLFIRDAVVDAFRRNEQLEMRYEKIITENNRIRALIGRNTEVMKNALLTKLLKGTAEDLESVIDWLEMYDIRFDGRSTQVIVFRVDDYEEASTLEPNAKWNLVRFLLGALTQEFTHEGYSGYPCELEQDLVACVLVSGSLPASGRRVVHEICEKIQGFMREHYQVGVSIGIGRAVDDAKEVSESFEGANDALEYGAVRQQGTVVSYEEIVDSEKEYFYPIDVELHIIKSVRAGDFERCDAILDSVFEENFSRRKLSVKLVRCLIFDMIGTAMKTLDQLQVQIDAVIGPETDPVDDLLGAGSGVATIGKIKELYRALCDYLRDQHSDRRLVLRERIVSYIAEHYTDTTLSQTRIADSLGISVPYLSSFFKQEMGESMLEYINRLRLEEAKRLLVQRDRGLTQVANDCGFGSDKTLIRLFKQYEGTTPGRYRDAHFVINFARKRRTG